MKNKIKILEPCIKGLPDHAIYLSMIGNEEEQNNWLLNNYIHITCNLNYIQRGYLGFDLYIDYNNCPYLKRSDIPYHMLSQDKTTLHTQLKELIDAGYGMQISLDEDKIPNRQFTNRGKVTCHNNFLYGYNNDSEVFLLGFFEKGGRFIFGEIDYHLFHETFCANEYQRFEIIKNIHNVHYGINLPMIKRQLIEFVNSENIRDLRGRYVTNQATPNKAFGLEVYTVMSDYYKAVAAGSVAFDNRPSYLMKERIQCMIKRLEYLRVSDMLPVNTICIYYKNILSIAEKCHSKVLYSELSKKYLKLYSAAEDILQIKDLERKAIEELIELL